MVFQFWATRATDTTLFSGAVQTYLDSLYSISGSKTIDEYSLFTSTLSEEFQHQGYRNAACDKLVNNSSK